MFAVAVVLLNALSFASLAYVANRKGHHAMAALAAAGAWLFGVTSVLKEPDPKRRAKAAGAKAVPKTQRKKARTPIEAEDPVNDASRHGAVGRSGSWRLNFTLRILEGLWAFSGLVEPGIGVGCGHAHARWRPNKFVAVGRGRLYDQSCRKQESAKCQNKQHARRPNGW